MIWISPERQVAQLNPEGIHPFADPSRFLLVLAQKAEDLLWCMVESLRSGAASLVIGKLPNSPGLAPVRRLHLATERGGAAGQVPLGLLLSPDNRGKLGIETCGHMASTYRAEAQGWTLTCRRARAQPPASWIVT